MKATLILDSEGPNPDYKPPVRSDFETDDEFHDAQVLYDVPPTRIVPAGTVISGPFVHAHCHPDDSGLRVVKNDKTGRMEPKRVAPGIVRAVPADNPCEVALARWVQAAAKIRRVKPQVILDEIAAGVAASKSEQVKTDEVKTAAPEAA